MGAAAHDSGIYDWAKIENKNSERDVHKVVDKQGTKLDIPITKIDVGKKVPWISPTSWLTYIVNHGLLYMLSGLLFEERHLVGATWKEFWNRYETLNPSFSLFNTDGFQPETTIGLLLHGDEGRTLKRSALMVTSIQSVMGIGFDQTRLKRPRDATRLQVNFAGHTFITRLVVSVLHKKEYQNNPEIFHETMKKLAEELKTLLETGLTDPATGVVYRFCLLGVKGDMPYLQKIGKLKRSWNTTVKRGRQKTSAPGVCHLCLAGTSGFPCEDTSESPCWSPTIGVKPPWDSLPEILRLLPHDLSHPGNYFKPDLWHCIHLGIGKAFVASTLQLALQSVPATNNDDRFDWLTHHYVTWCRSNKKSTHVSKITAYLVSWNDSTGATGNWSKGSLTTNLMKWLVTVLTDLQPDSDGFLVRCREAARGLNVALSLLYNSALFLEGWECKSIYKKGMAFLQVYTSMASEMFSRGKWHLFPLFPKIHAVHHVWHLIHSDFVTFGFAMNPLAASCQQDEDTIGRVSRTSRRVNSRLVAQRTLERHLLACYKVWREAKLIVWWDRGEKKRMRERVEVHFEVSSKEEDNICDGQFSWFLGNRVLPGRTWLKSRTQKNDGNGGWRYIYSHIGKMEGTCWV